MLKIMLKQEDNAKNNVKDNAGGMFSLTMVSIPARDVM